MVILLPVPAYITEYMAEPFETVLIGAETVETVEYAVDAGWWTACCRCKTVDIPTCPWTFGLITAAETVDELEGFATELGSVDVAVAEMLLVVVVADSTVFVMLTGRFHLAL